MFRTKDPKARTVKTGLGSATASDSRSKRQELTSRLRSRQQDEMMNRVRRTAPADDTSAEAPALSPDEMARHLAELPGAVQLATGPTATQQAVDDCVVRLRRILSVSENIPIMQVIKAGALPVIFRGLDSPVPGHVVNALWALTNITSGTSEETNFAVEAGVIERCIPMLTSSDMEIREQALWTLCNVAGDSPKYRDILLSYGVLDPVMASCHGTVRTSALRTAVWFLSNLCRGTPAPDWNVIQRAMPTLFCSVNLSDDNVIADSLWALAAITDSASGSEQIVNARHAAVVDHGFLPRLVLLLTHPSLEVKSPALRCVGNLTSGDDTVTDAILQNNAITPLQSLLSSQRRSLRREALWAFSNITAGTSEQIYAVAEAHAFPKIVRMLEDKDALIRKEAVWCVTNSIASGDSSIGQYLVSLNAIEGLAMTLAEAQIMEPRVLRIVLESFDVLLGYGATACEESIATTGSGSNAIADKLEELHIVDNISELQDHPEVSVCDIASSIIAKYFSDPDADAAWNEGAPEVGEGGHFEFGSGNADNAGSNGFQF